METLSDPLRTLLESGPYLPNELVDHLDKISTWIDEEDEFTDDRENAIQQMLERFQKRDGILIPDWWHDSNQRFLDEFRDAYAPYHQAESSWAEPWTPQNRQLEILATVLELWRTERDQHRERHDHD